MREKYIEKIGIKEHRSPIPKGIPTKIVYPTGEYIHAKHAKFAKDFMIPVGTPIEAMENGEVIAVKSDSDKYGSDPKYADDVNYVTVEHVDGSMMEYLHMRKGGSPVKVGDKVAEGQIVGVSGLSGCMTAPHLHANKFRYDKNGKPVSVPYDVEGVEDERATSKESISFSPGVLEKLVGGIFLLGVGGALLFFLGITGNVVGVANNSFYGMVPLVVGLIAGGVWMFLRKRI